MHKIKLAFITTLLLASNVVLANSSTMAELAAAREGIVNRYINDLGSANADDIISLFNDNGTVVSTSRGKMPAKDFFNAFLPEIKDAATKVNQVFQGSTDQDRMAARFHFTYQLKDGETGEGEYIDEFIFEANSAKLVEVIMFENKKFQG